MESKLMPWILSDLEDLIDFYTVPNLEHDVEYQLAKREAELERKQLERKEKEYADDHK